MPLPADNRLSLRKERDRLQKEGKTFHTRHFTLVTAPTLSVIASEARQSSNSLSTHSSLRGGEADAAISLHKTFVIPAKAGIHLVPRFSILLSKKTARLAVDRNRIKRVTSALMAELLPSLPPADYLVIPKRSALDTPHSDLLSDLSTLLTKLK